MLKQLAIPHGAQLRFKKTFYRTSPTYKNVEALRSPLCPRGHVDMFGVEKSNILLVWGTEREVVHMAVERASISCEAKTAIILADRPPSARRPYRRSSLDKGTVAGDLDRLDADSGPVGKTSRYTQ